MDARGLSAKDVQEYLGLGCVQSVYRWLDGINMPTIDNLYALSELFQLPIDEMVRGNRLLIAPSDALRKRLYIYLKTLNALQAA